MNILKFGGSSVATPDRISSIVEIVKPYLKEKTALVFSAFGGTTDQLLLLSKLALERNLEYKEKLAELEQRHLHVVKELLPITDQSSILAQVKIQLNELDDILHGIYLIKERSPRTTDYIMSFGERLSAFIITEVFKSRGISAEYLDARRLIRTDSQFGYAKVDVETTNRHIRDYFAQHNTLQVITGFIAASDTGETTTLGRSGSDYTAAIFAGALQASTLEIWTDVDGMMTADPRLVKKAFTVPQMSYEEATELSHFGAKVIFPATMQPAMAHHIPIWIKNTFNPSAIGTKIGAGLTGGKLIKGISSMNNISLLNIQGTGMLGVVGVSMRLFSTLAKEKINVILISQASSEHSICIAIETEYTKRAKAAIEQEFVYEIGNKQIDEVTIDTDLSIIAIVGDGMKHLSGTSGRMFGALGKSGINVVAIAQGASERNISAVIKRADISKALNILHEAFFLSDRKTAYLFLIGTGLIGTTLVTQIKEQLDRLSQENRLEIKLAGVANSKKMIFAQDGLPIQVAIDKMKKEGEPMSILTFVETMINFNLANSIFIDCTSSEEIASYYHKILSANISVVTPNKKANSGKQTIYTELKEVARKRGVRFLYETNVGAGLPVISTLNDLIVSGDKVIRIEGVLSGTLNFIFSSFVAGKKFSDVVAEAKAKGYTEPDPRDDLSGMDAARKILILSREAGLSLELTNVDVQNLVPEDCKTQPTVEAFFSTLKNHDAYFEKLRTQAEANGEKLRYQAILQDGKVSVKLGSVASNHPFYSLSGSDNIILLTTNRYKDHPMVIRGPGAGAEVTAAGVFADIIRIANNSTQFY